MLNEKDINILAEQEPGRVSFYNYGELKAALSSEMENYKNNIYSPEQMDIAETDLKTLKAVKKKIKDKEKELENSYSEPYKDVKIKLDELVSLIDEPIKLIDSFIKDLKKQKKLKNINDYAKEKAEQLGEFGHKVLESNSFFNSKWENITFKEKQCKEEIDKKIDDAANDINLIKNFGGEKTSVLLARYFETLSIEEVKEFAHAMDFQIDDNVEDIDTVDDSIIGYKILKITATEKQMAKILSTLDFMDVEVEEIEDGMPKPMEEILNPDFDSFVAFDIETTGTYGVSKGDQEAGITEIGAVKVMDGQVVDKFDMLANPGRKIVPMISALTHITNDMIKDAPSIDEVIKAFKEFCGDSTVIGHNIKGCDLYFICKAARNAGFAFDNTFLDTYTLAKKYQKLNEWKSIKLEYLAEFYGYEHKEAHRAWSDAEVNAKIYFDLKKLFNN